MCKNVGSDENTHKTKIFHSPQKYFKAQVPKWKSPFHIIIYYFIDLMRQSISKTRLAPVREVFPVVSYAGETSTRSHPTMLRPAQPLTMIMMMRRQQISSDTDLMISSAWILVRPPISGVPVPGQNPGSMASMSKLR